MSGATRPFSAFEWWIAWRYLRAGRAAGGVSVMTLISLAGVALAVFALVATFAVRSGFRNEFVGTILGANAHVTIYFPQDVGASQAATAGAEDASVPAQYLGIAQRLRAVEGVTRVAPLVRGQALATLNQRNAGVEVVGIARADLDSLPGLDEADRVTGNRARFGPGVALGKGVARTLGAHPGDSIRLVSPDGARTAFGIAPRTHLFNLAFTFSLGRYGIDNTRLYVPLAAAQRFFNREGQVDEFEVMVTTPEAVDALVPALLAAAGPSAAAWTWRDASGAFLHALAVEDRVMFVIMTILVLVAAMNIISGLIMLSTNKGREIGILRTIGVGRGSIMRIFVIIGGLVGAVGTLTGVMLGCLFAIYIDPLFALVDQLLGGGAWDPQVRGIYRLPARLEPANVIIAIALALGLSLVATLLPAQRAAKRDPVSALRLG